MKKYLETLKSSPLFEHINGEDLVNMLGCIGGAVYTYKKGQSILCEGDRADKIGIVLSGRVQIIRMDYYGNRSILAELGKSQLFGESFACAGINGLPISVVAVEDSSVMLMDITRIISSCTSACHFHNQMIHNLLRAVSIKNITLNKKIEITSQRSTREKLMTYLLMQAKETGRNSFDIPYDRQELADYLEVERSGLSAEISKLRRAGILESKNNHFILKEKING